MTYDNISKITFISLFIVSKIVLNINLNVVHINEKLV